MRETTLRTHTVILLTTLFSGATCTQLHAAQPADEATTAEQVDAAIRNSDYELALRKAMEGLESASQSNGGNSADAGAMLERIGQIQNILGRYEESEAAFRKSIAAYAAAFGSDHRATVRVSGALADMLMTLGRVEDATTVTVETLRVQEQALGNMHPELMPTLGRLAGLRRANGRFDEAIAAYERLLSLQERSLAPRHPDIISTITALGQIHREQGNYEQAEPYYRRLLDFAEETVKKRHPLLAQAQSDLADIYRSMGRFEEAEKLYLAALDFHDWVQGEDPGRAQVLQSLAILYRQWGKPAKQAEYERRAENERAPSLGQTTQ